MKNTEDYEKELGKLFEANLDKNKTEEFYKQSNDFLQKISPQIPKSGPEYINHLGSMLNLMLSLKTIKYPNIVQAIILLDGHEGIELKARDIDNAFELSCTRGHLEGFRLLLPKASAEIKQKVVVNSNNRFEISQKLLKDKDISKLDRSQDKALQKIIDSVFTYECIKGNFKEYELLVDKASPEVKNYVLIESTFWQGINYYKIFQNLLKDKDTDKVKVIREVCNQGTCPIGSRVKKICQYIKSDETIDLKVFDEILNRIANRIGREEIPGEALKTYEMLLKNHSKDDISVIKNSLKHVDQDYNEKAFEVLFNKLVENKSVDELCLVVKEFLNEDHTTELKLKYSLKKLVEVQEEGKNSNEFKQTLETCLKKSVQQYKDIGKTSEEYSHTLGNMLIETISKNMNYPEIFEAIVLLDRDKYIELEKNQIDEAFEWSYSKDNLEYFNLLFPKASREVKLKSLIELSKIDMSDKNRNKIFQTVLKDQDISKLDRSKDKELQNTIDKAFESVCRKGNLEGYKLLVDKALPDAKNKVLTKVSSWHEGEYYTIFQKLLSEKDIKIGTVLTEAISLYAPKKFIDEIIKVTKDKFINDKEHSLQDDDVSQAIKELIKSNNTEFIKIHDELIALHNNHTLLNKEYSYKDSLDYAERGGYKEPFEKLYKHSLQGKTAQELESELDTIIYEEKDLRVEHLLKYMQDNKLEKNIDNVFQRIVNGRDLNDHYKTYFPKLEILEKFFPYLNDKTLITKFVEKLILENKGFYGMPIKEMLYNGIRTTYNFPKDNVLEAFLKNDNVKQYFPSSIRLNELIKEKQENDGRLNLPVKWVKDLVSLGVDQDLFKDHKQLTKKDKQELQKITKEYEAAHKKEKYASKEEALDLIDIIREIVNKTPGLSYKEKGNWIEGIEIEFSEKNNSKLSKDVVQKMSDLVEEIEDKQQKNPKKSFIKELIDGIKNIFRSEDKKRIHNHRKESLGNLSDEDFIDIKGKLKDMMLKSEDQQALTHKNTRDMKPTTKLGKSK